MRVIRFALLSLVLAAGSVASAQDPAAAAPPGTLRGWLFDSTAMRPLVEATVQIVERANVASGKSWAAVSDSSGTFRVTGMPPGEYLVSFYHPRLDELGLSASTAAVAVASGKQVEMDMGIPGARRVIEMYCGRRPRGDSSGVLIGEVRDANATRPVAGAMVTGRWFELTIGARGMVRAMPNVRAETSPEGRFIICGLPYDGSVDVYATRGKAATGVVPVIVPAFGVTTQDLAIDLADTLARTDTAPRGTARVAGIVRGPSGSPLGGARVALAGSPLVVTTDADGRYSLGGLPGGTQTLEARAIGYIPIARSVNLQPNRTVNRDIRFDSAARILEAVEVRADVVFSRAENEFNQARKGPGYFIDREAIDRRNPFRTSDLLRSAPGVQLFQGGQPGQQSVITMRGAGLNPCPPAVFVDGMKFEGDMADIDVLLSNPDDLVGLAIYRGPAETPVQYQSITSCGAIVAWTRRGARPTAPRRR
ncbi:MAG TPA: carboxypeptidase regulatory-like domain-containing protein [Gemmatimonadaceae bacterium]|nr:carboxypeptidase regulatory-like domain-containing protein [Gemmatimonadaceae bacterium]